MARLPESKMQELRDRDIVQLITGYGVDLRQNGGDELKSCCPFHDETTPSFSVTPSKNLFYCFGCGAAGGTIDFVMQFEGVEFARALDIMTGGVANDNRPAPRQRQQAAADPDEWQYAAAPTDHPAPSTLRVQRDGDWREFPVVAAWPYRDATGELHAYDCRIEPEPGKKDIIPICWMVSTKTGEAKFRQKSLPKPRLPYGAELLAQNPDAQIIIVEGCKTADAARRLLAGVPAAVVSWMGGSKAVRFTNWQLLKGRKVVIWPDCDSQIDQQTGVPKHYFDQAGMAAALDIAAQLDGIAAGVRIVAVPQPGEWADGFDLADAEADGWTQADVMAYIREHIREPGELLHVEHHAPVGGPAPAPPPDMEYDYPPPDYDDEPDQPATTGNGDQPWRYLGCDRGSCFYLPSDLPQVLELSAPNHSSKHLLFLAPLHYWQREFPAEKRSGDMVDWAMAANALIQKSKKFGVYRPENVRGRGAWWDSGRSAVHVGDAVIIDGERHSLVDVQSKFIYEQRPSWPVNLDNALSAAEAVKLDKICALPNWERPINGKLLAGFCMLGTICGALRYRPSIWLTGESGSGKSTLLEKIVYPCVATAGLFAASTTTEAGIRQDLGIDSLPVVFDEFESEGKRNSDQVQEVLKLLTQSATDNGAAIIKGGANGKSTHYKIRSMFAFSSIGVNIGQHAARTRISLLGLVKNDGNDASTGRYNEMLAMIDETLTEEFINRLHARAISMIPVIRHNAKVFSEAGAVVIGMRRLGDQIGTLLAGCYALYSSKAITPDAARQWLESQDWTEERAINEQNDGARCLSHMLGRTVRVLGDLGNRDRSVGELVGIAASGKADRAGVNASDAHDTLRRLGIRVETNDVWIANNHPELAKLMGETAWANSWPSVLARIPGAGKGPRSEKFAGVQARYVSVPVNLICD